MSDTIEERPMPTGYKIIIKYVNAPNEIIHIDTKGVINWQSIPHSAPANQKTKKMLNLLGLTRYLLENGGKAIGIIELTE